jgi:hypothetical protein
MNIGIEQSTSHGLQGEVYRFTFATEAEAIAFWQGLDFVNDSAVKGTRDGCTVSVETEDE